jgi:hypothetical protein
MNWSTILKSAFTRLVSRKMVMFYLVLFVVFFLSLWNKLTNDNILIALGWIITNFVFGNIGEWKYAKGSNNVSSEIKK